MTEFRKIMPHGPDSYTYWISGIYKIVSYRKASYHAYFIQDHAKNWGDHVEEPPETCPLTGNGHWRRLSDAKAACKRHAARYEPKTHTIKRAAEILDSLLEKEKTDVT